MAEEQLPDNGTAITEDDIIFDIFQDPNYEDQDFDEIQGESGGNPDTSSAETWNEISHDFDENQGGSSSCSSQQESMKNQPMETGQSSAPLNGGRDGDNSKGQGDTAQSQGSADGQESASSNASMGGQEKDTDAATGDIDAGGKPAFD